MFTNAILSNKKRTEEELELWFKKHSALFGKGSFFDPIFSFLIHGGKRLRTFLGLLSYEGLGGKKDVYDVLISLELLHGYYLIHDDIVDGDVVRYHAPTVWAQYKLSLLSDLGDEIYASTVARSLALIAGDLVNSISFFPILESNWLPLEKKYSLFSLLISCSRDTLTGQMLDVSSSISMPSLDAIKEVYRLKTGIYSIALPLQFGAVLAGCAEENFLSHIREFAEPLGIAFQLHDDILGVFGDPKITGKSDATDIVQRRKTYLIMKTRSVLNKHEREEFDRVFLKEGNLTKDEVMLIKAFIVGSGAKITVATELEEETSKAKMLLDRLPFADPQKHMLGEFIDFVIKRDS